MRQRAAQARHPRRIRDREIVALSQLQVNVLRADVVSSV